MGREKNFVQPKPLFIVHERSKILNINILGRLESTLPVCRTQPALLLIQRYGSLGVKKSRQFGEIRGERRDSNPQGLFRDSRVTIWSDTNYRLQSPCSLVVLRDSNPDYLAQNQACCAITLENHVVKIIFGGK